MVTNGEVFSLTEGLLMGDPGNLIWMTLPVISPVLLMAISPSLLGILLVRVIFRVLCPFLLLPPALTNLLASRL